MKPTLKTFSLTPMQFKLHLHADETKWNTVLNEHIDTLVGLNEEVLAEGVDFHEKQYRGIIRDEFFEAKRKQVIGALFSQLDIM